MGSGRRNRPDPDLEDLLLTSQIRLRLEAEHTLREILDVSVIAIVEAAYLTHAIPQAAAAGSMLSQVGLSDEQGRKIGVAPLHVESRAERDRHRPRRLLDQDRARASHGLRRGRRTGRRRAFGQYLEILL